MEIGTILTRIKSSQNGNNGVKTASDQSTDGPTTDALRTALTEAVAATAPTETKTASVSDSDPTGDLLKMAQDLTSMEKQAMLKEAHTWGAAACDGFMERFAQYEDAALQVGGQPAKTAAVHAVADPDLEMIKTAAQDPEFQKFANENPQMVKEAFDLGFRTQWETRVKEAQADYDQGYNDAMQVKHAAAAQAYKTGALLINDVLRNRLAQQ